MVALLNPVFKKFDYGAGWPMVLGFGLILGLVALHEWRESREKVALQTHAGREKFFLVVFLAFVALSFLFSQTKNVGFSEVLAVMGMGSLYLLLAGQKVKWWEKFVEVVAVCGVIAVIWGYLQYLLMPETRMFGPFMNLFYHANEWPNAFALFLLMVWPLYPILYKKKWGMVEAILIGFVLSGLFLTYSRGAALVFVGQVVLVGLFRIKTLKAKQFWLGVLALLVAAGMFIGANNIKSQSFEVLDVGEKVSFEGSESATSKQERADFWEGAYGLMLEKPLLGWGPWSFRQAYNARQEMLLAASDHPHNWFLKVGAENGLVAMLALLGFLLSGLMVVKERWNGLSKVRKEAASWLIVAISGGVAHSLIDYNFNFLVNLLLMWMLLIMLRSLVVKSVSKKAKASLGLVIALVVAGFSLYEGGLLVLDTQVHDKSMLVHSFFPRDIYSENVERALYYEAYESVVAITDHQLAMNPLDARANYLQGVALCELGYLEKCEARYAKAIKLDPKNELEYYRAYYQLVDDESVLDILGLVEEYIMLAQKNVHFTAYTGNVETAAELGEMMLPYLPVAERNELARKIEAMLNKAQQLRAEKTF